MKSTEELKVYDFDVFKALVEIEVERIKRYKKSDKFSVAFIYFPSIVNIIINKSIKEVNHMFRLRENIRSVDVISPVDDDFVFLFFPETDKKSVEKIIKRIQSKVELNIIEGIASFPEDGKDSRALFDTLVKVMNDKLLPVIKI
ncbi:MAG: hypothetical protein N2Z80_02425 [Hydrogenothermaceae bacterium]|nr:hypothetical protein [Hydrogenothermaceae bacterium]